MMVVESWANYLGHAYQSNLTLIEFIRWDSIYDLLHKGSKAKNP